MNIDELVKKWSNLPHNLLESQLNFNFTNHLWNFLGFHYEANTPIAGELKPKFIIYDQFNKPLLVVETKKRVVDLANISEPEFVTSCHSNNLYREAIGNDNSTVNGIRQYLSVKKNPAKYGLVFNGDFFQLFWRSDGLIIPLMEVQKVTKKTLPKLIYQLDYFLKNPNRAFIVSIWNRKGGIAKTTNIINIAAVLSAYKKRVLVVDFDPQVDLTRSLGVIPEHFKHKLLRCFDKIQLEEYDAAKKLTEQLIQKLYFNVKGQIYPISILPANKKTLEDFSEYNTDEKYHMPKKATALRKLLSLVRSKYDYILIDTSPKTDILTACSLFAADGVIIPSDYDPETLRHAKEISCHFIPKIIRSARQNSQRKKSLVDEIAPRLLGLVFSNSSNIGVTIEKEVARCLDELDIKVYKTKLRHCDNVVIAKFFRKPVVFYRPKSQASQMYIKLTEEIFMKPNFVEK
ncbi:ParA family protein [Mastigocoleus sp. MO_188.B34]|uniref:ParA family protein n=1 Tax=Mastigocoleus sp. MO_188.B34 TaxID=3036635 RepID=UPI00262055F5|nr:ParA family protein [Mastigocoleus sp. MO_188.B34]MDJ0695684.1 ParA family protein [Mastigocoleus sp. MO_188.B34]